MTELVGGANRWTNWVKEFASKNNLSYGCALSTPACKDEYKAKYGNRKKLTKKQEKEMMGAEDKPVPAKKARKPRAKKAKKIVLDEETAQEIERERMGAEEATGKINKQKRHKEKVVEMKSKLVKNIAKKEIVEKGKQSAEKYQMGAEDINQAKKPNINFTIEEIAPAVKKRGRPKKYETAEEARQMKIKKTIEASKRRQAKKREEKANKKKPPLIIEEDSDDEQNAFPDLERDDSDEYDKARDFVFNYTPKKMTIKYKEEFNKYAKILKRPLEKQQDDIFEKLKKQIIPNSLYRDDARSRFDDIVRRATPFNEAETIWNINRERFNIPLLKTYKELGDEISKIPTYNITGRGFDPLPDFKDQVASAEGGMINPLSDPVFAEKYFKMKNEKEGMSGGHWTANMLPHLKKELSNYENMAHHLGQHLQEKGAKDPKDITGFHHFSREAERVRKLLARI